MTTPQQTQQSIYAIIPDNSSWEDIIIFLSLKEAETSLKNDFPRRRIEHFVRSEISGGYIPSYLVTYGKNWGLNNNHNHNHNVIEKSTPKAYPGVEPFLKVEQNKTYPESGIEEGLLIYTKYYQLSEPDNKEVSKCSLR
jgi:hypothetical protein